MIPSVSFCCWKGGYNMFFNNILNELDGDSVYGLTPELKGLFLYKKFKNENKNLPKGNVM